MWRQVEEVGNDILAIGAAFPEGINLIGYSQGGLLARAILQRFPEHNVKNFISLSSPQAGQYGSMIENISLNFTINFYEKSNSHVHP